MDQPTIGGLFFGYGGLDLAVAEVLGARLGWYAETDGLPARGRTHLTGAAAVAAHHYPGVPNLGNVSTVNWSTVTPVTILTAGSPCQDLSTAGRRAGMTEGTRSNLWVAVREAIAALRPPLVVWENVHGAYSAAADSELGLNPGLLGQVRRRDDEPVLRALGRVLGDLTDLGYDARWCSLSAATVGAPHGRPRVFLAAYPHGGRNRPQTLPRSLDHQDGPTAPHGTPRGDSHRARGAGLPDQQVQADRYGDYASAVHRWETVTRPAPPQEAGVQRFTEWMMGLPDGWVTDVPGLSENQQRSVIGNGVIPQQAAHALRHLLTT